jgi:hypothetical protein
MISAKELVAHIEEDDKSFRRVIDSAQFQKRDSDIIIELMKEALADDEKLKARLEKEVI